MQLQFRWRSIQRSEEIQRHRWQHMFLQLSCWYRRRRPFQTHSRIHWPYIQQTSSRMSRRIWEHPRHRHGNHWLLKESIRLMMKVENTHSWCSRPLLHRWQQHCSEETKGSRHRFHKKLCQMVWLEIERTILGRYHDRGGWMKERVAREQQWLSRQRQQAKERRLEDTS